MRVGADGGDGAGGGDGADGDGGAVGGAVGGVDGVASVDSTMTFVPLTATMRTWVPAGMAVPSWDVAAPDFAVGGHTATAFGVVGIDRWT